ncbi:MAG: histidine--tRNA ligase [Oscillospiraceae bacterium]|nr:histidine--tRNA ligase [Oscillospiraceae bacterium]
MPIQAPKGTRDILPADIYRWHYIESIIRGLCKSYGYREIRVPLFEHTELFSRGVGETTDIVQKEMYTFDDKAGRSLTLRPEGTAGVARAYIENGMQAQPAPQKLYYYGPMYRYENVQHGRYREFWQFGCEVLGAPGPGADVELISILKALFEGAGFTKTDLRINSIGCPACRPAYHKLLRAFFESKLDRLCADCKGRFERNPLRIIDCKQERCKQEIAGAPMALDHVCSDCLDHFEGLKSGLSELGIAYSIDKTIVRGLDYYTRTVFEFLSENVKSLGSAICGGGRYDGLIGLCGGPDTPGVGFSVGIERLFIELDSYGVKIPEPAGPDIFVVVAAAPVKTFAARLVDGLRRAGLGAELDLNARSVKAQMKFADRRNAVYTVVLGDDELSRGSAELRKMADGTKTEMNLNNFVDEFKNIIKIPN